MLITDSSLGGRGWKNGCAYPEVEGRDQGCVDGKGAVNGTEFEMSGINWYRSKGKMLD